MLWNAGVYRQNTSMSERSQASLFITTDICLYKHLLKSVPTNENLHYNFSCKLGGSLYRMHLFSRNRDLNAPSPFSHSLNYFHL